MKLMKHYKTEAGRRYKSCIQQLAVIMLIYVAMLPQLGSFGVHRARVYLLLVLLLVIGLNFAWYHWSRQRLSRLGSRTDS